LKEVHEKGYIHRDVKPANFVMGTSKVGNPRNVIMIDYGLARRHLCADGSVRPKRKTARWVGSRRYMSINTHNRKEQGRRDDMWSLLYVLIEFLTGTLPWSHLRGIDNLDKIRDLKIFNNNEKLVRFLPDEFMKFMYHIKNLKYASRPDYEFLHGILKSLFERNGGNHLTPFEWETPEVDITNLAIYNLDDEEVTNEWQHKIKTGPEASDESITASSSSIVKNKTDSEDKNFSSLTKEITESQRCNIL